MFFFFFFSWGFNIASTARALLNDDDVDTEDWQYHGR